MIAARKIKNSIVYFDNTKKDIHYTTNRKFKKYIALRERTPKIVKLFDKIDEARNALFNDIKEL